MSVFLSANATQQRPRKGGEGRKERHGEVGVLSSSKPPRGLTEELETLPRPKNREKRVSVIVTQVFGLPMLNN